MKFSKDVPPKQDIKEQEIILFKKEIAELVKESSEGIDEIKKEKLFKYLEAAVENPVFFQQEQDNISLITQYFLNEEDFIDEYFDEDDPADKIILDKRIKDFELRKDGYLDFLKRKYSTGDFSKKIIILSLLTQAYARAPFFNNSNSRNGIFSLIKDFSEKENGTKGNYFLDQYLEALLKKDENIFSPASLISKDIYSYYLDDKLFISNEKDKQEIALLLDEIKQDDLEFSLLKKKFGTDNEKLNALSQKRNKDYNKLESFFKPAEFKDISNLNPSLIDEEKNMVDFMNYSIFLNPKVRKSFEEDFSVSLNNLSIKEQFRVIEYLKDNSSSEIKRSIDFSKKYKENGLRTFLSIEQGGKEMGDKILELGEKLPEEIAQRVFSKYGEIVKAASLAEEEIKKLYKKQIVSDEVFNSVRESLLKKGAQLLTSLADNIQNIDEKKVLEDLEDIKTTILIMSESYVQLFRQKAQVPFEEVEKTSVEMISAISISKEEKDKIIKVYQKGRPKNTYENPEHLKLLIEEFQKTLDKENTILFNIKFSDEIVAFATFYKINENTLHVGGLTFIEDIRNPIIAEAVMSSIMNQLGNYNIEAEVDSKNKILRMYTKRFGFKIIGQLPEEIEGEVYYKIFREKNSEQSQVDKDIKIAA